MHVPLIGRLVLSWVAKRAPPDDHDHDTLLRRRPSRAPSLTQRRLYDGQTSDMPDNRSTFICGGRRNCARRFTGPQKCVCMGSTV